MATKSDFTDEEWKTMQSGVVGAGMYVATVDGGFFDSFKEASALAHHLQSAHERSESPLIRELTTGHEKPFGATSSPAEVREKTVDALREALALIEEKSPGDADAYRAVVLDVAEAVAEAVKGVSPQENDALAAIRAALEPA